MLKSVLPSLLASILLAALAAQASARLIIGGIILTDHNSDVFKTLTANGTDTVAVEIFDKMIASSTTHGFVDATHATQHWHVRKEIITAIGEMGSTIHYSFGSPRAWVFPAGFKATGQGRPYFFKQSDPRQKASDGIKAIETGTTETECVTCLDATILIGHRRAYGDAWIDANMSAGSIVIDSEFKFTWRVPDTTHVPGDYLYMSNPPDYEAKAIAHGTTNRVWTGENTIYEGGDKYSGLGLLHESEADLREDLRNGYNTDTGESMTAEDARERIRFTIHSFIVISPKAS